MYSSHDAGFYSFYTYMRDALGLAKQVEPMNGLIELAQSCGWWAAYSGCAILQHRHSELRRNDEGRLHSTDSMAVKYRDGWGVWAISGVVVDEQIVMRPEEQLIDQLRKEQNAEIKRIRIERYAGREADRLAGWRRYLRDVGASVTHKRRNDIDSTDEALMHTPDGEALLICACPSTARVYAMEVPREIRTCESAQNWMRSGSWLDREKMKRRIIAAA